MNTKTLRTISISMAGNLFEWYDYALFGYFAPIIGHLFNPSGNKTTELLYAYGIFAVGFIMRPLGAIIFGRIGDRIGRKRALVLSITMMAVPTACVAVLPTYNQIGITATVLLILVRMIQGISIGGNYSGSITYMIEHTPTGRRGLISGFVNNSIVMGFLLGSATSAILAQLMSVEDLNSFGWRIPFALGSMVAIIGYYIHRKLDESPAFKKELKQDVVPESPFTELLSTHRVDLVRTIAVILVQDVCAYTFLVFFGGYVQRLLNIPEATIYTINTCAMLVFMATSFVVGHLSDIYGRRAIHGGGALGFAVLSIPLFTYLPYANLTEVIIIQFLFAILLGLVSAAMAAILVEAYPTRIRNSAIGLTVNISGPLFGGTAPMLLSWLTEATGSSIAPAYYITGVAAISFVATLLMRDRYKQALG